uniref:Uncharacterized protein n=1 Tax=candidate division WOR-3 bacterium TaxID=2052148 RepID=A0A7C4XB32_UNCW3
MKTLKYVAFALSIITIILSAITHLFFPGKSLLHLAPISYLRLTGIFLLYTIAFHLLFPKKE